MKAPDPVQRHPNATFALSSTPFAALIAWAALSLGVVMPQYVSAALGTIFVGVLLIFRTGLTRSADAVWTLGVSGCCKRLWKGNQSTP